MKKFILTISVFFSWATHSYYTNQGAGSLPPHIPNCQGEAEKHLAYIANAEESDFDVSKYKTAVTMGEFPAEASLVYSFSRSIVDSWEIELTATGCFPLRIEFIGDL